MILEIMTREMEGVAYACTKSELNYKFTPTEMTGIVKVRITDKGKEISPVLAYRLSALVSAKIQADRQQQLPDDSENNVLILIEDLP